MAVVVGRGIYIISQAQLAFVVLTSNLEPLGHYDEIVEHNAVIEASKLAQEKGSGVYLKDISKR